MFGMIDMFRSPSQKEFSYNHHKDIMKKLKFIGKIDPGDRINVNNVSTSSNSLFSSVYRILFKESRVKTYQFLSDIIDRSFELIILYQNSKKMSDKITCSHIIEDLHHAITGLKNIQHTYIDDRNFYCDIDTLIGSIYARLAEYYQQDHSIFTEEQRKRLHVLLFPNESEDTPIHPVLKENTIVSTDIPVQSFISSHPPQSSLSAQSSLPVQSTIPAQSSLPVQSTIPTQSTIPLQSTVENSVQDDSSEMEYQKKKEKHKK